MLKPADVVAPWTYQDPKIGGLAACFTVYALAENAKGCESTETYSFYTLYCHAPK